MHRRRSRIVEIDMNRIPQFDKPEIERLVASVCDRALGPEDSQALNDLLRNNVAARKYYLDYILLHGILYWDQGRALRVELQLSCVEIESDDSNVKSMVEGASLEACVTSHQGVSENGVRSPVSLRSSRSDHIASSRRPSPALLLALTACLVMLCFIASRDWWGGDRSGQPDSSLLSQNAASTDGLGLTSLGEVKNISGSTEIQLLDIGYLVLDGPTELKFIGPKRMQLVKGRIRVRVTEPSGYGFVVVTPHGEVTDLGTEFGIDASDATATDLVVFEGAVDLRMPGTTSNSPVTEKLSEGEGIRFGQDGILNRIMSISTGNSAIFRRSASPRPDFSKRKLAGKSPVIVEVSDDLSLEQTKGFYEIVPGGMGEDVLSFVDRPYQWNGLRTSGMPKFLLGADYVKTFCSRKIYSFEITVKLAKPADLYIFWDDRVPETKWLKQGFTDTGFALVLDEVSCNYLEPGYVLGVGPGVEVDHSYSVWHRAVAAPGQVKLGSLEMEYKTYGMYGIAAVEAGKSDRKLPDSLSRP